MKIKFSVIALLYAVLLLGACGGGGGGGGVTPESLAGTWYGTAEDPNGIMWTVQVTVDNTGTLTSIIRDGVLQEGVRSTGPVVREDGRNVFSFTFTDGTAAGFIVDGSGQHLGFVDEDFWFGVLQKGASSLPSYNGPDIAGSWNGYTAELSSTFDLVKTYDSQATVETTANFSGSDSEGGAFNGSIPNYSSFYGRWTGTWTASDGSESGGVRAFMSVDKTFVATYACSGAFPAGCSYSVWNKQ